MVDLLHGYEADAALATSADFLTENHFLPFVSDVVNGTRTPIRRSKGVASPV